MYSKNRRLGLFSPISGEAKIFFLENLALHTFFLNKQSIFDPRPQNSLSFSKKLPQKLFSYCLVDGPLTLLFKYSNILNVAIVYYRDT